jgi:hypothetical protein
MIEIDNVSSDRDDNVRALLDDELDAVSGGYGEIGYVEDVAGGHTTLKTV